MTLSHISELRPFLSALGASPKKSLSQNFLVEENVVEKIVHLADIQPGDTVLEIGPGAGAITEKLLQRGAHVLAVEKDRKLAASLKRLPNLEIYEEDILTFPLEKIPPNTKIVSNLPFHLTSPILARFVTEPDTISQLTVLLQEEMARRILASPSTSDYSSLTLFLKFYATTTKHTRVSRHCFYPKPKVDATLLTLTPHRPPPIPPEPFFTLVRTAFQQRRKALTSSLSSLYPKETLLEALVSLSLDPKARPETLSLPSFLSFFQKLTKN
ncbi:MAG: Ribosomal RNA small subunit methyltransferase A [Chlamydiae bacterium]|nr:Ribosomal RNA small subunit methyltransferase A [Chlamydiota bacterium]